MCISDSIDPTVVMCISDSFDPTVVMCISDSIDPTVVSIQRQYGGTPQLILPLSCSLFHTGVDSSLSFCQVLRWARIFSWMSVYKEEGK